jgi:NADH-quinone oxidoreductase subunit K
MLFSRLTIDLTTWAHEEVYSTLLNNLAFSHELLPFAVCIFLIGLSGFLESREFLSILVNTEIMMLGANFHLITSSLVYGDYVGQVYALCFLAITAAETAIGLGILILLYRVKGKISFDEFSTLRG